MPNLKAVCSKMFDDDLDSNWHGPSAWKDPDDILINLPADKISVTFKVSIFFINLSLFVNLKTGI